MATVESTVKEVIRRGIASSLYEDVLDPAQSYFVVLGRSYPWIGDDGVILSLGGETVPYPIDSVDSYNETNRDSYFAKRIGANDIRLMLPLVRWTRGTRYAKYASNINIFDERYLYYVYTTDGSVYKCLENGKNTEETGLPSLFEPDIKDTANPFKKPDGYTWKYMFTVPDYERRLVTEFTDETNYIPISRPGGNYSLGERILQFEVQENAVAGTVDSVFIEPLTTLTGTGSRLSISSAKSINYKTISGLSGATSMTIGAASLVSQATNAYRDFTITITDGPAAGIYRKINGYTWSSSGGVLTFTEPLPRNIPTGSQYQIAPTIKILGDGTGADGYLKLTEYPKNFGLDKYIVTKPGKDYTVAFLSDPIPTGVLSGFDGHANVSPPGGHGYDAIAELNPTYLQLCVDINGGETASTLHLADGKFRQIAIIKNPRLWNSSQIAGTENKRFQEVVIRSVSGTADVSTIVNGNYIFGETSKSVGKIENVRNTGRDWRLLLSNLNGNLITQASGTNGENISVYSHGVPGTEFKRLSKDTAVVVSSVPYIASNATNQVYKLTTTVGISGSFSNSLSSYKGGWGYLSGISSDKFNSRIFSVRSASGGGVSHYVELTGVVGLENLIAIGTSGALSFDRLLPDGSIDENDGSGIIVSIDPPAFEPLSGEVVYIENTEPKTRSRLQTERVSILIKI